MSRGVQDEGIIIGQWNRTVYDDDSGMNSGVMTNV